MANSKISALTSATTPLAGTETLPVVQSSTTKQVSVANLTAGRAVSASSLTLTTALTVGNGGTGTSTAFTAGSVVFAGASGIYSQNNSNFFWDNSNVRLGIGTATPATTFHIFSTTARPITTGNNSSTWTFGPSGSNWAIRENSGSGDFISLDASGNTTFSIGNLVQGTAAKGINFTANTGAAGKTSQLLNWYEEGTWTATLVSSGGGSVTMTSTAKYIRVGTLVFVSVEAYAVSISGLSAGNLSITGLPFTCSANSPAISYFNIAGATSASAGAVVAYASNSTTITLYKSQSTTVDVSSLTKSDLNSSITIRFNGTYSV